MWSRGLTQLQLRNRLQFVQNLKQLDHKLLYHQTSLVNARSNSYAIIKKLEKLSKEQTLGEQNTSDYIEDELEHRNVSLIDPNSNLTETFIDYLKVNHTLFNKTMKNLKSLEKELNSNQYSEPEKFHRILQFFVSEFEKEIDRLMKIGIDNLDNMMANKQIQNLEALNESLQMGPDEDSLMEKFTRDFLSTAEQTIDPKNESASVLKMSTMLFSLLEVLMKTDRSSEIHKLVSPMDYVQIFEISKNIPVNKMKMKGLYLSGSLIYRIKNSEGKSLSMDPINESFFIDSLMAQGEYKRAIILFKTKMDKVNQKWWMEMGMMLYLKTNQLKKFNKLFKLTVRRYGEDQINVKPLKLAIVGNLKLKNAQLFNYYFDFYKQKVLHYGLISNDEYFENINNMNIQFENEDEGNDFLNRFDGIRDKNLFSIVVFLIYKNHLNEAEELISMYEDCEGIFNPYSPRYQINKFHLFLRKTVENHYKSGYDETLVSKIEQELKTAESFLEDHPESIKVLQNLLIKNITKLSKNTAYTKDIATMFLSDLSNSAISTEDLSDTEKYRVIIKFLLNNNSVRPAKHILHKMENSETVTSSIYSEFLNYYSRLIFSKTVSKEVAITQVEKLLKNVESNESLIISNVYIDQLLKFYVVTSQWEKLPELVNEVLDHELNNSQMDDLQSCTTTPLFKRIFELYARFQHMNTSLPINSSPNTSNNKGKERPDVSFKYTLDTLLQHTLIKKSLLPDEEICGNIIKSLVLSQNWTSLITLILFLSEKYDVKLSEEMFKYILKGIKFAYISKDMKSTPVKTFNWKETRQLKARSTSNVNKQIHNKEIMSFVTMDDTTPSMISIYSILEYLIKNNEFNEDLLQDKMAAFEIPRDMLTDDLNKLKDIMATEHQTKVEV